jgi:hypothetical protein
MLSSHKDKDYRRFYSDGVVLCGRRRAEPRWVPRRLLGELGLTWDGVWSFEKHWIQLPSPLLEGVMRVDRQCPVAVCGMVESICPLRSVLPTSATHRLSAFFCVNKTSTFVVEDLPELYHSRIIIYRIWVSPPFFNQPTIRIQSTSMITVAEWLTSPTTPRIIGRRSQWLAIRYNAGGEAEPLSDHLILVGGCPTDKAQYGCISGWFPTPEQRRPAPSSPPAHSYRTNNDE